MPQAIGDPEEIEQFARALLNYVDNIRSETERLSGFFDDLGNSWQDSKRSAFEEEFKALTEQIEKFASVCDDQVPYLKALAEKLRDYLQC